MAEIDLEESEVIKPDPALKAPELYQAVKNNDTNKALDLLNEGVPPTYVDEANSWTPINWAAKNDNVKLIKKILEVGGSNSYHELKNSENELNDGDSIGHDSLLSNTPLMWASYGGNLRIVWLLLIDGYNPDDLDPMGNNCLHLAASSGHSSILQVLVDDGANPFISNVYKNRPIDVASKKECRDILSAAMDKYSTLEVDAIKSLHMQNIQSYSDKVTQLNEILQEAAKVESPRGFRTLLDIPSLITKLSSILSQSNQYGLDYDSIQEGYRLLKKLERTHELIQLITNIQSYHPIISQLLYSTHVQPLEQCIQRAEQHGVDRQHLQYARDLIVRCQSELLISISLSRLQFVECATDSNEADMIKLKYFIQKGQALQASNELILSATSRLKRLECELEIYRSLTAIPIVKLPIENPPNDYWTDEDLGRIQETEEYPLPPASNNGEYIWEHSQSFMKLSSSIDRLRECTNNAESLGANEKLIKEAGIKLIQIEKEMKLLDVKDAEDKRIAIENAVKAAKKLKKGKKAKK